MTQHALLVEVLEGLHKQNETRNFQQLIEALRKPPGAPTFAKSSSKVRPPQILENISRNSGQGQRTCICPLSCVWVLPR